MTELELQPKATYLGKSNIPLNFYELAEYPGLVAMTITYDDETGEHHLLGNGILTFDKTENSFAYGDELQIHVRFVDLVKEKPERAVNNGHKRAEICMKETEGENFLRRALKNLKKLREPNSPKERLTMRSQRGRNKIEW